MTTRLAGTKIFKASSLRIYRASNLFPYPSTVPALVARLAVLSNGPNSVPVLAKNFRLPKLCLAMGNVAAPRHSALFV
ncbi:hypothetical protein PUN4_1120020 [Paraburkholderia unamae]|nr:hypothetical protein PUN4_1120020 [Paraburkholderia unamae]